MEKELTLAQICSQYNEEFYANLKDFISIPSFLSKEKANKKHPFGPDITKALNYIAKLAKQKGFEVNNYDNKVVEILYGQGEKDITILAHADVVPPGDGWKSNPFEIYEDKGVLYARGVSDDKGPLLASFYAIVALKEKGLLSQNYKIRFLVGGNEESGSKCMKHYFSTLKKPQPTCGFSPDAHFPLVYGEKGIINYQLSKKIKLKGIESIEGGTAINSVIDKCVVVAKKSDDLVEFLQNKYSNITFEEEGNNLKIIFYGVPAHGSCPQEGKNAGISALNFVAEYLDNFKLAKFVSNHSHLYGRNIHCYGFSLHMGQNSLNIGQVKYKNNQLTLMANLRFVNTCDKEEIKRNIENRSEASKVKFLEEYDVLYFDPKNVLVKTLLEAYQECTQDYKSLPLCIGGGTYAKEANNVIAFGAEMPRWDSMMHSNSEQISKEDLYKCIEIYATAILKLGKLIDENKI